MSTGPIRRLITRPAIWRADSWEGVMHPMFVKLFIETDEDDLLTYEEEKRRRSRRVRHTPSRTVTRVPARDLDERQRRP